jgi:glycosyltransferase involved in cell wall biosynthesis
VRICFIGSSDSIHVVKVCSGLVARGHEVAVLTFGRARIPDCQMHYAPPSHAPGHARYLAALPWARQTIRALDPDVVNAIYIGGHGVLALAARPIPLVATALGSDVLVAPQVPPMRWIIERVLRRAAAVLVMSAAMADAAAELGARRSKLAVIPIGINLQRFAPPPRAVRRGIVHVRPLERLYNVDQLLHALPRVLAAAPTPVQLIGDGPERQHLEALAARLDLGAHVRFSGRVSLSALVAAYQRASVYVSVSRTDGTSVSLLEALGAGAFPVLSNIPANREWVVDDLNGLLVPLDDPAALAEALLRAEREPKLVARARTMNRLLVEQRADEQINLTAMERVLVRAARGRGDA